MGVQRATGMRPAPADASAEAVLPIKMPQDTKIRKRVMRIRQANLALNGLGPYSL